MHVYMWYKVDGVLFRQMNMILYRGVINLRCTRQETALSVFPYNIHLRDEIILF